MVITDDNGRYVDVNPAACELFGRSRSELLGARSGDAAGSVTEEEQTWRTLATDGSTAGLHTVVRPDGEVRETEFAAKTNVLPGRHLSVLRDVTERRDLERELWRAQRLESVGRLAGGVAHDFNNMLTAILGYAELLTEQIGPDKPIGADLQQIKAAAERAAVLTRQLLAFSRKQVLAVTPIDLTQIVHALEPILGRLLGEHITIKTELAEGLNRVMADAAQLEHLLINLSVNARDAMSHGGVLTIATRNIELDVRYTRVHPGAKVGAYAALSVTDTGAGMSREVQAKIFEPFFTTKERGHGTGLGLAAVYGTVKQLAGYIDVESRLGYGSRFTIYLPVTAQAPQTERAPSTKISPVGTETILLVEDENGVRAFAKIALQRFGYRVLEAASAEAGLELQKNYDGPIHLLLTDLVLTGMDGRELAVCVKRDRPQIGVLFMSGYADRLGTIEGFLEPDVQLLEKPFSAHTLLTKAREVLGADAEPNHF
jgi:PAS domain S-box-containing protein